MHFRLRQFSIYNEKILYMIRVEWKWICEIWCYYLHFILLLHQFIHTLVNLFCIFRRIFVPTRFSSLRAMSLFLFLIKIIEQILFVISALFLENIIFCIILYNRVAWKLYPNFNCINLWLHMWHWFMTLYTKYSETSHKKYLLQRVIRIRAK